MQAVLLTVHALIVLALIVVVLLQRSDGSALGLGGGGGGGFMTGRGAANALTRTTSVLGALFFATSLALAFIGDTGQSEEQVIEELTGEAIRDPNKPATTEDLLNTLGRDTPTAPAGSVGLPATGVPGATVPVGETPSSTVEGTPPAAAPTTEPATNPAPPATEPPPQ